MELFKYNTNKIAEKLLPHKYILDNSKNIALVYSLEYTHAMKNILSTVECVYVAFEYHMFNFLSEDEINIALSVRRFDGDIRSTYSLVLCFPENENIMITNNDFVIMSKYIILKNDVAYS
jgi:hypothetical protein